MEKVARGLEWAFTWMLYPTLIAVILIFIVACVVGLINRSHSIRTAIGGILPVAALVFLLVSEKNDETVLIDFLVSWPAGLRLMLGLILGVTLIEAGKIAFRASSAVGAALYALYLSTVGVFVVYALMSGLMRSIHLVLFGLVLGGGLDAIFRGVPEDHGHPEQPRDQRR